MRADYLSHKRAAGVSVWGLILQAVFGSGTLIYGLMSNDHAAVSAAWFMLVGVIAWLTLAILFDQHRRERIEAMEAEALSAESSGASVFESRGEEFRVAARRLAGLYKFFVPGVSILIGTLLLVIAVVRFRSGVGLIPPGKYQPAMHPGWQLGVGFVVAFVGFIFARYASGMAKQKIWQNLRAGASYAVGSALLGLAVGVGQLIDAAGPDVVLRYLQVAIPVFCGLIGAEVFLNFVLDIYRPRKAGETPRPAFDSRILGFAAAPDRIAQSISEAINYQLGFDVTGGWMYQLISRSLWKLGLVGLLVMWGLSCMAVLQPHQRGMLLRFGRPVQSDLGPGLHFKAPWPIDTVYIPEYYKTDEKGNRTLADLTATGVRTIQLATTPPATKDPILWTNEHLGEEVYQLVRAGSAGSADPADRENALKGMALVSVEMPLQYSVENVALFDQLAPPEQRDTLLQRVAQRELTLFFQNKTLDAVLGAEKSAMSDELRARVERAFAGLNPDPVTGAPRGAGVRVLYVGIVGVHPPREQDVAASFEKVVESDQRYAARIEAARAEQIRKLTSAAGSVETGLRILREAEELERLRNGEGDDAAVREREAGVRRLFDGAGGESASRIASAKADRWERVMGARSRAAEYEGLLASYEAAPAIFRVSRYFDALKQAMSNSRVYIVSDGVKDLRIDTDLQDKDTNINLFTETKQ